MDQLVETYPTMWVQLCLWLAKELIKNDNIFVLLYYSRKSQFFFFFSDLFVTVPSFILSLYISLEALLLEPTHTTI